MVVDYVTKSSISRSTNLEFSRSTYLECVIEKNRVGQSNFKLCRYIGHDVDGTGQDFT